MNLKIGLLRNINSKSVEIYTENSYQIKSSNSDKIHEFSKNDKIKFHVHESKVSFRLNNITIGAFDTIYLKKPNNDTTSFSIVGIKPSFNKRSYYDELIVLAQKVNLLLSIKLI